MLKHKIVGTAVVAVLLLGGAACGGSSSDASGGSKDNAKTTAANSPDKSKADPGKDVTTYGDDTKLPAEWPDGLSFPKGTELIAAFTHASDGSMDVSGLLDDGDGKKIEARYRSMLADQGYTVEDGDVTDNDSKYEAIFDAKNADRSVNVDVDDAYTGTVNIEVTITPNG